MNIQEFVKKSMAQDSRNIFEKTDVDDYIPEELKLFYQEANPIDVEITMDGNAVRFIPMDELEDARVEYSIGDKRFVFASCNGDPIYIYEGQIYTCCHGVNKVVDEFLAKDLETFFELIN